MFVFVFVFVCVRIRINLSLKNRFHSLFHLVKFVIILEEKTKLQRRIRKNKRDKGGGEEGEKRFVRTV